MDDEQQVPEPEILIPGEGDQAEKLVGQDGPILDVRRDGADIMLGELADKAENTMTPEPVPPIEAAVPEVIEKVAAPTVTVRAQYGARRRPGFPGILNAASLLVSVLDGTDSPDTAVRAEGAKLGGGPVTLIGGESTLLLAIKGQYILTEMANG